MNEQTAHGDPDGPGTVMPRASVPTPLRATVEEARTAPIAEGRRSSLLMVHGSMEVRFYAPRGIDDQTPHTQDELYIVAQGSGWFVRGDQRTPFSPGDVLFVPADATHRFEDISHDFGVWVIFYGPEGGEEAGSSVG